MCCLKFKRDEQNGEIGIKKAAGKFGFPEFACSLKLL